MVALLADTAPLYEIVKKLPAHFNLGKESLEDGSRCGRPTTATTDENIAYYYAYLLMQFQKKQFKLNDPDI